MKTKGIFVQEIIGCIDAENAGSFEMSEDVWNYEFTYSEALKIKNTFFPEFRVDFLYKKNNE